MTRPFLILESATVLCLLARFASLELVLLVECIDHVGAIGKKAISIGVVPHHLLGIPRTRCCRTVLDIDHIVALEVSID